MSLQMVQVCTYIQILWYIAMYLPIMLYYATVLPNVHSTVYLPRYIVLCTLYLYTYNVPTYIPTYVVRMYIPPILLYLLPILNETHKSELSD